MFQTLFVCFSPYLGGGAVPRGPGHNLLVQFYSLGSSKMEISETVFFFDILTIQKYQISYVKDVVAPCYVVFTLFGCWGWVGGGGGGRRFHLSQNSVYDINRDPVGPAWRRLKAYSCVPTVFVCSVNYPRASLRFTFDRKVPMVL